MKELLKDLERQRVQNWLYVQLEIQWFSQCPSVPWESRRVGQGQLPAWTATSLGNKERDTTSKVLISSGPQALNSFPTKGSTYSRVRIDECVYRHSHPIQDGSGKNITSSGCKTPFLSWLLIWPSLVSWWTCSLSVCIVLDVLLYSGFVFLPALEGEK